MVDDTLFARQSLVLSLGAQRCADDINGDGVGDLLMSAPNFNLGGFGTGRTYVVFGVLTQALR